ncbi:hypothetical protein CYLTODRAFT_380054 [Cylindrobasidium torrendii FP15055 ss-10]|uniref:Uncharacterized protein n=1 Tax=Cylindrobasidium torrendii FP15055 ss-10 TaxID=1314674 RepID=A0A0D7B656_9AGAR|nr:hypothetical protein CYLTODRAFT_380054 [Cylindrobasidium torrendii FP15055 ss-10]
MTHNTLPLTKPMLETLLLHLSGLLTTHVRLVVHGGASMLLHPDLERIPTSRISTMDVDYLHRGLLNEYGPFVGMELIRCIQTTASRFPGLGTDWMNSEADISLPTTAAYPYDPVYHDSIQPHNVALHTVYTSPNGKLTLVSVTPCWGIALKLVRFVKYDMIDIGALLRNGTRVRAVQWTPDVLERWLRTECSSMRYDLYDQRKLAELRSRIQQATTFVQVGCWAPSPSHPGIMETQSRDSWNGLQTFSEGTHPHLGASTAPFIPAELPKPLPRIPHCSSQQPFIPPLLDNHRRAPTPPPFIPSAFLSSQEQVAERDSEGTVQPPSGFPFPSSRCLMLEGMYSDLSRPCTPFIPPPLP